MFGKIPTTDDPEAAEKDLGYLDSVSAIRVETYHLTNARWVITGWEDARPSQKSSQKTLAKKITTSESPTKSPTKDASASDSDAEQSQGANNEADDLRPIDEKSDKGQFALAPRQVPCNSRRIVRAGTNK